MKARAPRILMVGTALDGRGGVAAVLSVLRAGGLFEREAVRYVSTHREGGTLAKLCHASAGLGATLAACLLRRPAIVHAHASSGASFVRKSLVLLLARASGCKTIFHLHGGTFREYALERSGALMRRWIRHTLERSSLVIALSDSWAAFLEGFAPKARVAVVPNAVPLPPASATAPASLADPADSHAAVPGRILFLGRLEAAKGTAELLDAVAQLAPRFPQLRLVMGGSGDLEGFRRDAERRGIAARIDLPGWLDAAARDAELARASVFCLPSHAEGLPMAVLEAMAAGKAVVASSVGGIPELVRDGENGLLVPPRDGAALACALARLLEDEGLRSRLGASARKTVEAQYSTQAVCGRLAAIYNDLAGTR
ncbi:glycosyltransferase family 4 protein [Massilia sp. IC2-278]|uniref:glycosyltransferase family 4 protein n=1 Tax=Massilia sp. IC2-278 TaxID=2887200 RepID=UPI001E3F7112|nr:glycosyltransferase family 4 protein [Massilia sp. IC2-278]MCC2962425.1 glycosyltransferase family 4 protein [Massilia sp. IC2-278]